jgi:hypothetical protein
MSISKLPAPSSLPSSLPSGTVRLYQDSSWSSSSLTIDIHDYASGKRQSFSGTSLQDKATWIAFNLPVGTVMTLTNNFVVDSSRPFYDLKDCGEVVDLVGTGQTEAVDLTKIKANDKLSMFFWRSVDLGLGAIELYEDANFSGNRTVLFLSEWARDTVHSMSGWYIHDRTSAARWSTLADSQMASLFNNTDGSGSSYSNIKGWGSFKELANFKSVGVNDQASSFSWSGLVPKKEVIEPVQIDLSAYGGGGTNLYTTASGKNDSSAASTQSITLEKSDAQTTTLTVTSTFVVSADVNASYSVTLEEEPEMGGMELGGAEESSTLEVAIGFIYANSAKETRSVTQTTSLSVTQDFTVPPHSTYQATLTVQMGQLPPSSTYTTTAYRWYADELPGSVLDPENGWYKRPETVTFQLSGALACGTKLDIVATPLAA